MDDLRYALRGLRTNPGFALVAVLTLALGIGSTTGVFSVVYGLLWRPLPFPEPDGIVVVESANPARGITENEVSLPDLRDFREQANSLSHLAALLQRQAAITGPEGSERVIGWVADPALFELLGARAAIGRPLRTEDARPDAPPVTVLSHALWNRLFGGDSTVVGTTVPINGLRRTIVGVMPRSFQLVRGGLYVPLVPDPAAWERDDRSALGVGRLAPGATVERARQELAGVARRLESTHPGTNRGWTVDVLRYRDAEVGPGDRRGLLLASVAVALVLLVACANVAGLMLARAAARVRELAVRAALGANRARLGRQLLVESLTLSILGAALGVVLASWWTDALFATLPGEDVPPWLVTGIDARALGLTAGAAALSALLFGLVPALRASRPEVVSELKGGGRGATARSNRLRQGLVVAQVAMSVVLLAASTLFTQSFLASRRGDLGFDDRDMVTARVFFGGLRAPAERVAWMRTALEQVRRVPGVRAAALTGPIPGDDGGDRRALMVDGAAVSPGDEPLIVVLPSSDGYFETLGSPLLAGRGFTAQEADDSTAAVAVIGQALARRLWPNGDAIGRRVRVLPDTAWLTIVGVAREVQIEEFGEDVPADRLQLHLPYGRERWRGPALLVRTAGAPAALAEPIRLAARAVHPDVPVFDVLTMGEVRSYTTAGDRVWVLLFGTFGAAALLMAAVGLYGLLAFGVAQRRREIGVRVALGARPASVVALVVGQATGLTGVGLVVGLVGGLGVARSLRGELWGVGGPLPSLAAVSVVLLATALAAAFVPSRRAARVDPMVVLREE